MTWKNTIKKATVSDFDYTTELNKNRDGNSFSISGGKGVYEVEYVGVEIKWSLTFENSEDSLYIQEPTINRITVFGVDVSFDEDFDAADVEYDIEDEDVVVNDPEVEIVYGSTLYGELPMTLFPTIDADIVRDGDKITLDDITIYFE